MMVNAMTKQKSRERGRGEPKLSTSVRDTLVEGIAKGARQQAHRHGGQAPERDPWK